MESADETAAVGTPKPSPLMDAAKERESTKLVKLYAARIDLAAHKGELKAIGAELTPEVKSKMLTADAHKLRNLYLRGGITITARSKYANPVKAPKQPKQTPAPTASIFTPPTSATHAQVQAASLAPSTTNDTGFPKQSPKPEPTYVP